MTFEMLFHHPYSKIAIVIALIGAFLVSRRKIGYIIAGTVMLVSALCLYFYTMLFLR